MAQDDDLDREIHVLAAEEADQLEDATERPVQEREGHRRMLAASGAGVKVQLMAHGWRSRHPQATEVSPAKRPWVPLVDMEILTAWSNEMKHGGD